MKSIIVAFLSSSVLFSVEAMKPEFHWTIFIAKPAKAVWSALTEKDMIDQYHMAPVTPWS